MRPHGAHPVYWRTFKVETPTSWAPCEFRQLAGNFKGKLPNQTSPNPTRDSVPYLLVEGLETGAYEYTSDHSVPLVSSRDTIVVADGSRSGWVMRGKEGALGSTLLCYQPKQGVDPDFLFYLLQSFYGFTNTATIGGAVPHLDTRLLDRLWITTPTEEREQQKIGAILSSVDAALTAGQSKLTAARRLKTALMQQLFTRGIPGAHTEFKQTKIGEVPGPWDVVRLQTVLAGPPFNGVSPSSRPNPPGTPILNVECIDDGHCSPCNVSYVDVDEVTAQECRARRGDFYVLRGNGNRDYVATGGYLSEEPEVPTIFSDKLIRLRFDESKLVERFIPYLWQNKTFLHRLQSKAVSGSGLWMMGKRDIRREFIAYPVDKGEQGQIVELIDAAIQSILACEAEVASLERLKRSLLQNLITGRVPVRIEP